MSIKENTPEIRSALEFASELTHAATIGENNHVIVETNGHTFMLYNGLREEIFPKDVELPDAVHAFTLSGFVAFVKENVDGFFSGERHHVVVESIFLVRTASQPKGNKARRHCAVACEVNLPKIPFDTYMSSEDFIVMLMTHFEPSENLDKVLSLAGCIRAENSLQVADDGFSQRVTVRRGIVQSGDVVVKNPVTLRPRRTFHEVWQPESPFVLRFKDEGLVGLFEADGGAWKNLAVRSIGKYLEDSLAGCNVVVIA